MLLEVCVAIIFAKLFNTIMEKLHQPGVIGEILAGIVLGPCLIGSLSGMSFNVLGSSLFTFTMNLGTPEFKDIAFIGVIFLLFIVGLETNMSDLKKTRKAGLLAGVFGIIVPLSLGTLFGQLLHLTMTQSLALGTIMLATSITIAVRILSDLDMLSTRIGLTLNTAIILNDVLAMIVFALVFGNGNSIVLLLQILLFFGCTIGGGLLFVRYTLRKNVGRKAPMVILTSGLVICFLFAAFAENLGITAIIGAFIAGLFIRKTPQGAVIVEYVRNIGYAFFIPLFFVWVGASFDFIALLNTPDMMGMMLFIAAFVGIGIFGNFLGGSIGARLSGLKGRESISVGIGMMPVMGVALIIVTTGIDRGIFGPVHGVLANQVKMGALMLIVTSCLITPPLMRRSMTSPLLKSLGKTKTKLSFYHHPHCTECDMPLRLDSSAHKWFCDGCGRFVQLPAKRPVRTLQNFRAYNSKWIQYLIGGSTILICALTIPTMESVSLVTKVSALVGIFLGTTLAFLTVRYLFAGPRGPKTVARSNLSMKQ